MMNNMKAKLVEKSENHYDLYVDGVGLYTSTYQWTSNGNLLSLKNCQAIERGYDLDELVKIDKEKDLDFTDESSFRRGFLKALEILGDRRFTEEDMSKAWSEGYHRRVDEINGNELRYFDKLIQSLQQTEWEVEIEMILAPKYYGYVKKLDADGCLILKRVV